VGGKGRGLKENNIKVFEVDGIKIGLIRGLDVLYPSNGEILKE